MQQLVGKTSHLPVQNSGKLICCVGPGHKLFVAAQHEPNCCYGPECAVLMLLFTQAPR